MKLAFCFMSYGDVDHADIWLRYFQDAPVDQYTILIHTVNDISESVLPNCKRIPTQPTKWGEFSLVEAQQSLFHEACKDPAVSKCILVSGDSLPLYSFAHLYRILTSEDKGYMFYYFKLPLLLKDRVGFLRKKNVHLNFWPQNRTLKFSLTYQWCIMTRFHVQKLQDEFDMLRNVFTGSYIPDEHVYSVYFESIGLLNTFHLQMVNWIRWDGQMKQCSIEHRRRPVTFHTEDFTEKFLKDVYSSNSFFIRKICKTAVPLIDWSGEKLLLPTVASDPVTEDSPKLEPHQIQNQSQSQSQPQPQPQPKRPNRLLQQRFNKYFKNRN